MAPNGTTHFHTMSNSNINALMLMIQGALQPKNVTVTVFKIVEIGTDKLPVSILEIASINATLWEKKAYFDSLSKAMSNHIDNLSTLDLITTVTSEVHIDTTAAFFGSRRS